MAVFFQNKVGSMLCMIIIFDENMTVFLKTNIAVIFYLASFVSKWL
jgi:hypothetical protein